MITPCLDIETRVERIRMALAEVGVDGSTVYAEPPFLYSNPDVVPPIHMWRASMITGAHRVYCFACWEADMFRAWESDFAQSCVGLPGVVDCGRTDR